MSVASGTSGGRTPDGSRGGLIAGGSRGGPLMDETPRTHGVRIRKNLHCNAQPVLPSPPQPPRRHHSRRHRHSNSPTATHGKSPPAAAGHQRSKPLPGTKDEIDPSGIYRGEEEVSNHDEAQVPLEATPIDDPPTPDGGGKP